MGAIALELKSPDDELITLKKLAVLSKASPAKSYLTRYIQMNDSIQDVRNAAKNQFALIRYNFEKSNADNLVNLDQIHMVSKKTCVKLAMFNTYF